MFFNDTATTEIYTLSLHDALPIFSCEEFKRSRTAWTMSGVPSARNNRPRSEEHTSELQSQSNLVCRLLLEKKKVPAVAASQNEYLRHGDPPRVHTVVASEDYRHLA